MKTLKLVLFGLVLLFAGTAQAQISLQVNIGAPPMWGPAGYTEVRYYYLPDVEAYYDIQASLFIYQSGTTWVHRTYLPSPYRDYDLYGGYKVVMSDYRGSTPYDNFNVYKVKYAKGNHWKSQKTIGEKPGNGNGNGNNGNGGNNGNHGNGNSNGNGKKH
jgi:hypothetical protein